MGEVDGTEGLDREAAPEASTLAGQCHHQHAASVRRFGSGSHGRQHHRKLAARGIRLSVGSAPAAIAQRQTAIDGGDHAHIQIEPSAERRRARAPTQVPDLQVLVQATSP